MLCQPRDRLIVALDLSSLDEAKAMVARAWRRRFVLQNRLSTRVRRRTVLCREALTDAGKRVFVDLKLHDIGNTVAQGVKSVARLGATFLTVHAYPQTMKAAVDAREGGLRILGVTVLTSFDDRDLKAAGYETTVQSLVAKRAAQAREIGVDGLVCSPEEARGVRSIVGPSLALVTPGIRPAGSSADEQKRIATPASAIAAGADYLRGRASDHRGGRSEQRRKLIVAEIAASAS